MTDALLHSIPIAAKRISIGRTLLYEKIASGEIKTVLVGRRRLVPESELQAWVAGLLEASTILDRP